MEIVNRNGILVKRIIPRLQIAIKILKHTGLRNDFHRNGQMRTQQVFDTHDRECPQALKFKVFAERKPVHGVKHLPTRQIDFGMVNFQHRRACINNVQLRITVIDVLDVATPLVKFVNLVQKQMGESMRIKVFHQIEQVVGTKPKVVQRGVKHILQIGETLFDML